MVNINPRTPVLVGVSQWVGRNADVREAPSPLDSLEKVTRGTATDSGINEAILSAIDWIVVVRTFADSGPVYRLPGWNYTNLPLALADRIGAKPGRAIYPEGSGSTPQWAINLFAGAISRGDADICLLAGAENTRTARRAQKEGVPLDWSDQKVLPPPEVLGLIPRANTRTEARHGIVQAATTYAMFENALAHHYRRTPVEHRKAVGKLMERFSSIAAENRYSTADQALSADTIINPGPSNSYVAYPYTKYLCSNMYVDQAASVLMMAHETADRIGIADKKRVYLHGSAETTEKWLMSERLNYWSSPSIKVGARVALDQAGVTQSDLSFIDLYPCFASSVQVAADAIGIQHDDPRGLTITGGLPYFGGPGSNYTTHAIAEMVARLRAEPTASGLIFANGAFLSKHAFGVYSASPPENGYERVDPRTYQQEIDRLDSPRFCEKPNGIGQIETFTVLFDEGRPKVAPIFGRLETGERLVANITDPAMLEAMIDGPVVGRRIEIVAGERVNIARLF